MVNVLYTIGQIDILENGHDTNTFLVLRMVTHVPIVINLLIPLGKLDKLNCIQCICTVEKTASKKMVPFTDSIVHKLFVLISL